MTRQPDTNPSGDKLRQYHDALADILCWIDGYNASCQNENAFRYVNTQAIRELKSDLYGKLYGKAPEWIA